MDLNTINKLVELNNNFYAQVTQSFSNTRQHAWSGMEPIAVILRAIEEACPARSRRAESSLNVTDFACGNLRFERYLTDQLPDIDLTFNCIDNCDKLFNLESDLMVNYTNIDIISSLISDTLQSQLADIPQAALTVSFGFLHHVPTFELRQEFLRVLVNQTKSGGYIAVSFWQFMQDAEYADKVQDFHSQAVRDLSLPQLDPNDYIIGWQNKEGVYRYCHHFDDSEIESLLSIVSPETELVEKYSADGKNGQMNCYLVLQKTNLKKS